MCFELHRSGARSLGSTLFTIWLVIIGASSLAADAQKPKDDEDAEKLPGLLAIYSEPQFVRYDAQPAFALARGQTPDPRLKAKDWKVLWKGVIKVPRSGNYLISAEHSGGIVVFINGQFVKVADANEADARVSDRVNLSVGLSNISVQYTQDDSPPLLRLYWEADGLPRERIPTTAFGHMKSSIDAGNRVYSNPDSKFTAARLAVEESNCTACHLPRGTASSLIVPQPAPPLTNIAWRLNAGWIYNWLGNPQSLRPDALMPRLFTNDEKGSAERYAVAAYLKTQTHRGGSYFNEPVTEGLIPEGERLFNRTGCRVCHDKRGEQPAMVTLASLGQKYKPIGLENYLKDPLADNPGGRMPSLNLHAKEAAALAAYLGARDAKDSKSPDLPAPPSAEVLRDLMLDYGMITAKQSLTESEPTVRDRIESLGYRIMEAKNCGACHEFQYSKSRLGHSFAKHDLADICDRRTGGCLSPDNANPDGKVPHFGKSLDRAAVSDFLSECLNGAGSPAPGEDARLTLLRYNCLGCHERNGEGGLAPDVVKSLAENQTQETAEMVSPPSLTGVTGKLRESYLKGVLLDGKRSRPWMSLRMPQFPKEVMATLPAGLAALDAEPLDDKTARVVESSKVDEKQLAEAGRTLVGSRGFGCTKCHDMLGVPSGGTRGPDLSLVADRVRFEWFDRWMTDPQRIQPGTRMPTVFLNGASPYKDVLDGDPAMQRLAVWHYLSNSKKLPPPEGLEQPKAADVGATNDNYQCVRTFLPDVTPRSMGIRFKNGVHLAYDLQACRLAYGWSGDFLDMSPVWNDRGGNPARLKGPVFWHSPAGFPWDVTVSAGAVPDFTGRGTDTSLGAALPYDGKLHPTRLDFRGYHLDEAGPTFRFELQLEGGSRAKFTEQVISLQTPPANGALRRTTAAAPANQTVWLNVATAEQPPHWSTADGKSGQLDSPEKSAPADAVIRVVQEGKPVVVHLRAAPPGAVWLAAKQANHWCLAVRMPAAGDDKPAKLDLAVLCPANEAAALATVAAELGAK